jgi:hypothetical protein
MTRVDMERRLVKAEIAISLATALVRRQKEVLAGLKRRDYEATADLARAVLATLEESLRLHIEDCDQIARELDAARPVDGGPSPPGSLPRLRKAMPAISDEAAVPEMPGASQRTMTARQCEGGGWAELKKGSLMGLSATSIAASSEPRQSDPSSSDVAPVAGIPASLGGVIFGGETICQHSRNT